MTYLGVLSDLFKGENVTSIWGIKGSLGRSWFLCFAFVYSNQGYNPYKWVICPLTRVINLHITSYLPYPEPLSIAFVCFCFECIVEIC